jgi:nitrogen fixation NifU-like protein
MVRDIAFEGTGCAILMASASMMALAVIGKRLGEAQAMTGRFVAPITALSPPERDDLGDLAALAGVQGFPARVK